MHSHEEFVSLWEKHHNELVHGPMLGNMSDSSVSVWVRTVSETPVRMVAGTSKEMTDPVVSTPVISRSEDDYTAVIQVDGLEPDTFYYYEVLVGEDRHVIAGEGQKFRTNPVMEESLFGYNEKNSFGLVRFNTELENPEITYRVVDID